MASVIISRGSWTRQFAAGVSWQAQTAGKSTRVSALTAALLVVLFAAMTPASASLTFSAGNVSLYAEIEGTIDYFWADSSVRLAMPVMRSDSRSYPAGYSWGSISNAREVTSGSAGNQYFYTGQEALAGMAPMGSPVNGVETRALVMAETGILRFDSPDGLDLLGWQGYVRAIASLNAGLLITGDGYLKVTTTTTYISVGAPSWTTGFEQFYSVSGNRTVWSVISLQQEVVSTLLGNHMATASIEVIRTFEEVPAGAYPELADNTTFSDIPEPSSLSVLVLAAALFPRRRGRGRGCRL